MVEKIFDMVITELLGLNNGTRKCGKKKSEENNSTMGHFIIILNKAHEAGRLLFNDTSLCLLIISQKHNNKKGNK